MVAWILQLLKANGIDTGDTLAVSGTGSPHWASGKWVRVESRVISTYFTLVCIVWEWEFSCDIIHVRSKVWHEWTCLWDRNRLRHREQTCGCHEGGSWGNEDRTTLVAHEPGVHTCCLQKAGTERQVLSKPITAKEQVWWFPENISRTVTTLFWI